MPKSVFIELACGDNVLEINEKVISSGPIGALTLNEPFTVALADSAVNATLTGL